MEDKLGKGRPKQLPEQLPSIIKSQLKIVKLEDYNLKLQTMGVARLAYEMAIGIGEDEGILREFTSDTVKNEYRKDLWQVLKDNKASNKFVIKQMVNKIMLYKR